MSLIWFLTRDPFEKFAQGLPEIAPGRLPGAAAELVTRSGRVYRSGSTAVKVDPHPAMRYVLDKVKPSRRPGFHGHCAEVNAINKALNAGDNPVGGRIRVVTVRERFDGKIWRRFGDPLPPCNSCKVVLEDFGIILEN